MGVCALQGCSGCQGTPEVNNTTWKSLRRTTYLKLEKFSITIPEKAISPFTENVRASCIKNTKKGYCMDLVWIIVGR
jgi:hypothetical protein